MLPIGRLANTGTEVHDNLIRSGSLVGAWAEGVTGTKVWNNIVMSKGKVIKASQNKNQDLASALALMDYNLYDAPPVYDFGEYTSNRQRLSLDHIRAKGFEVHSHVISSSMEVFEDEQFYRLLPRWRTAGGQRDALGPEDIAAILDVNRYGPSAAPH